MKFCPVVPEICHGQVHVPQKERKKEEENNNNNNNNNKKRSKNNKLQFVYNFPFIGPLCRVWVC
jgi:hypothetical protein